MTDPFTNAEFASTFFGASVVLTMVLAWASRDHVLIKLAAVLMGGCALSNLAVHLAGFDRAPMAIPSVEVVMSFIVCRIGWFNRSRVGLAVFVLYGLGIATWVGAIVTHTEGRYLTYFASNVIFGAKLLVVGGTSVALGLAHIAHWGVGRADPLRSGG